MRKYEKCYAKVCLHTAVCKLIRKSTTQLCYNIAYQKHGGGNYFRQNDVTITLFVKLRVYDA